jgi:hypothetical protein
MTKKPEAILLIVEKLEEQGVRCNCDLDNWQPESSTGHSWVCRIHKAAWEELWAELTQPAKATGETE